MKVTQPLGSFLPDSVWTDAAQEAVARHAQQAPRTPVPSRSLSPAPQSQYSYVSTAPPPSSASTKNVVLVQEVTKAWRPDPSLTPQAQRGLCEQLYPYAVESCFVLSVVAVPESVGYKSRVAAELALALAESGHPRILLLEGDLHRPWVQRMIGVDMPISSGFSQQLNGRAQGSGSGARWTVMGCTRSLHVLAEGMMRSPGLMLSRQFADCLKELRTYYDFIVIDGPSASLDVDSGALDAVTDGIVTVCPAKGSQAIAHMQSLFARKRFSAFATAPDR
jgi:Mrp family chromosome partitioning ATPase